MWSYYPYRDTYNKAIGQSDDCLIFIMGIPIPVKTKMVLYTEAGPSQLKYYSNVLMAAILGGYKAGTLPSSQITTIYLMTRHPYMMTSSNGNIFHVTSHLCGEFTGHRWIPRTKASNAELWCFLWSAPAWTVVKTIVMLVIWDAIMPIMTSDNGSGAWSSNEFQWPDQDDRVPG